MEEDVGFSRDQFIDLVREFVRRIESDDRQEALSQAILLDLTLEADNAASVLGLSAAGVRTAGEDIRASFRAYQHGDRSRAAELAGRLLSAIGGQEGAGSERVGARSSTLSLVRAPDGNYWIRILDEQLLPLAARETSARTVGPLKRSRVFHELMLLGLTDRHADAFIENVDVSGTAEIRGVQHKPPA